MRQCLIVLLVAILSACSTTSTEDSDGAPTVAFDASSVGDAQPAPVTRTRAGNPSSYTVFGKTYRVLPDSRGYQERGEASWYGTKFHGRKTSNGETYNMYAMTAAHKTLPIPSYVRVTNVSNGRSVVVRINDRGPFHGRRIIDLSYAAAKKLGIDKQGVGMVDVVDVTPTSNYQPAIHEPRVALTTSDETSSVNLAPVLGLESSDNERSPVESSTAPISGHTPQLLKSDGLYLQLGAFNERRSALLLQSKVESILSVPVTIIFGQDQLHRVNLGPIDNEQKVPVLRRILQEWGLNQGLLVQK